MNILFILYEDSRTQITKVLNVNRLMSLLAKGGTTLGLISNSALPLKNRHFSNLKMNALTFDYNWDKVIVHDESDITYITAIQPQLLNNNFILLLDEVLSQPFYLSFKPSFVIASSLADSTQKTAFHYRNVKYLPWFDLGLSIKQKHTTEVIDILYYLDAEADLQTAISLIKVMNLNYKYRLYILCNNYLKSILKQISSDILLISVRELVKHQFCVVLGSGKIALSAVLGKLPTIVLGRYGYGSMVTPENINAHFHHRFNGRIGGYLNEHVPIPLLLAEIMYALNFRHNNPTFLNDNKSAVLRLSELQSFENAFSILLTSNFLANG